MKPISICLLLSFLVHNSFCQTYEVNGLNSLELKLSNEKNNIGLMDESDLFNYQSLKSTSQYEELDSLVRSTYLIEKEDWLNKDKREYVYENKGKKLTEYWYTWDTNNNMWANLRRHIYEYDDKGNKIEEIQGLWQPEIAEWGQGYKEEWAYNSSGLLTLNAKYYRNTTNEIWEGDTKVQYTYDEQGNTLEYISSEWNDSDKAFRSDTKETWVYSAGILIKYTSSLWSNTLQTWIETNFSDYLYNDKGLKVKSEYFRISKSDTLNKSFADWVYNEEGLPILHQNYTYSTEENKWHVYSKEEFLFDSYGNKTMVKSYSKNSDNDSLMVHQKNLYSYDEKGNKTYEFYSDYEYTFFGDKIVGLDSFGYQTHFNFNNDDLLVLELHQQWYSWSDPNTIFKFEYEYNDDGKLTCLSQYKSNAPEEWDGLDKLVIEYTELSNIKQYTYYYWDDPGNDWILS